MNITLAQFMLGLALPTLAALLGILLNRQESRDLRASIDALRKDVYASMDALRNDMNKNFFEFYRT